MGRRPRRSVRALVHLWVDLLRCRRPEVGSNGAPRARTSNSYCREGSTYWWVTGTRSRPLPSRSRPSWPPRPPRPTAPSTSWSTSVDCPLALPVRMGGPTRGSTGDRRSWRCRDSPPGQGRRPRDPVPVGDAALLAVIDTGPHRPEEIESFTGIPVIGTLAFDPIAAATAAGQPGGRRRLSRSLLLSSAGRLAGSLTVLDPSLPGSEAEPHRGRARDRGAERKLLNRRLSRGGKLRWPRQSRMGHSDERFARRDTPRAGCRGSGDPGRRCAVRRRSTRVRKAKSLRPPRRSGRQCSRIAERAGRCRRRTTARPVGPGRTVRHGRLQVAGRRSGHREHRHQRV